MNSRKRHRLILQELGRMEPVTNNGDIEALQIQETGIVNPVSNYYGNNQCAINCKEELSRIRLTDQGQAGRDTFYKTLLTNWRIWAVRKDIIVVNGLFREEIKAPENVLADFSLRMIQKEY